MRESTRAYYEAVIEQREAGKTWEEIAAGLGRAAKSLAFSTYSYGQRTGRKPRLYCRDCKKIETPQGGRCKPCRMRANGARLKREYEW